MSVDVRYDIDRTVWDTKKAPAKGRPLVASTPHSEKSVVFMLVPVFVTLNVCRRSMVFLTRFRRTSKYCGERTKIQTCNGIFSRDMPLIDWVMLLTRWMLNNLPSLCRTKLTMRAGSTAIVSVILLLLVQHGSCFVVSPKLRGRQITALLIVGRTQEPTSSKSAADISSQASSHPLAMYTPLIGFLVYCLGAALLLVSWEDITCQYTLPSRHRTSLSQLERPRWGASTVRGMGFGQDERNLIIKDDLYQIRSYNEIMLEHRLVRVPSWKDPQRTTSLDASAAIHIATSSLQTIWKLQTLAKNYQWDVIRTAVHSYPLSELPQASAVLRSQSTTLNQVVGFDWGSCAWRTCGALADTQEALDELEYLLGVLEPYEAVFCLDICERSIRDILGVMDWKRATPEDAQFYQALPPYQSIVKVDADTDQESDSNNIDEAYLSALKELRID